MDEVDRLMELTYQFSIKKIVSEIHTPCMQYLFFSATCLRCIELLNEIFPALFFPDQKNPVLLATTANKKVIRVTNDRIFSSIENTSPERSKEERTNGTKKVSHRADLLPRFLFQFYIIVPRIRRLPALYTFLKRHVRNEKGKAIVFFSSRASTIFHFKLMSTVRFRRQCYMLHGKMKHRERLASYTHFRKAESEAIMFTTDVSARGLDIPEVSHILQYDPPTDPVAYVHRIGRTARGSNVGRSFIFLDPLELDFVAYLRDQFITLSEDVIEIKWKTQVFLHKTFYNLVANDDFFRRAGRKAYLSFTEAYRSYKLAKIFRVEDLDSTESMQSFGLVEAP